MKFLECPDLLDVTLSFFSGRDLGDKIITGCVEAYSCKKTVKDKKFSRQLETKLVEEISNSPKMGGVSPLGPLGKASTRKLLINLISTMNASFPDYDFSDTRPRQFEQAPNRHMVVTHVNNLLLNDLDNVEAGARETVWKAIDANIDLENVEIYSFIPDEDSDVFSLGKLWSFNYFFFNKRMKKVLFFQCSATRFDLCVSTVSRANLHIFVTVCTIPSANYARPQ